MIIKLDKYNSCTIDCPFSSQCANYSSAAGFRKEDGFSPELSIVKEDNELKVFCATFHKEPMECDTGGVFEALPKNYYDLNIGFVIIEKIKKRYEHIESLKRKCLVKTAEYWFNGARAAQINGKMNDAFMLMENAFNHTENALYAYRDLIREMFAEMSLLSIERTPKAVDISKFKDRMEKLGIIDE